MVTPETLFDESAKRLDAEPYRTEGLTATYQFDISGEDGGYWFITIVNGKAEIVKGLLEHPDVTVTMKSSDFVNMGTGKLSGQEAFMSGKLRVKGNIGLGMRLADIMG
jgi:putative sterol carrier protein